MSFTSSNEGLKYRGWRGGRYLLGSTALCARKLSLAVASFTYRMLLYVSMPDVQGRNTPSLFQLNVSTFCGIYWTGWPQSVSDRYGSG